MNERSLAGESGNDLRQGWERREQSGFVIGGGCRIQNYSGGGLSSTLDASYYKGPGARNGKEREFLAEEIKKGGNDNSAARNQILQALRETYGEKAVQQWGIGMLELVQQKGLLLNGMYESGLSGEATGRNELEFYSQICASDEGKRLLRDLRKNRENGCASYRHESAEQQTRESNQALQKLPFEATQNAERLLDMWETGEGAELLQQALSSFQKIWRPSCDEIPKEPGRTSERKYIVRRLTPLETCRLQGYPDDWSEIRHYDDISDEEQQFWENIRKQHAETYGKAYKPFRTKQQMVNWLNGLRTDSAEYKAYGNSLAIPCAEFVIGGIVELVQKEEAQ